MTRDMAIREINELTEPEWEKLYDYIQFLKYEINIKNIAIAKERKSNGSTADVE